MTDETKPTIDGYYFIRPDLTTAKVKPEAIEVINGHYRLMGERGRTILDVLCDFEFLGPVTPERLLKS